MQPRYSHLVIMVPLLRNSPHLVNNSQRYGEYTEFSPLLTLWGQNVPSKQMLLCQLTHWVCCHTVQLICNCLQGEIMFKFCLSGEQPPDTVIYRGALTLKDGVSVHIQQEESFSAFGLSNSLQPDSPTLTDSITFSCLQHSSLSMFQIAPLLRKHG